VQEARVKVSAIRDQLPAEIVEPIIDKIDFSSFPIVSLAVRSDRLSPRELTDFADKVVQRRIENVPGVGKVDLVGTSFREVSVDVLPERLEALGLGVDDVIYGLRAENVNLPVGRLNRGGAEQPVRVAGKPADVDEYRSLVVTEIDGQAVTLGEVAEVRDTVEEKRTLALVDGRPWRSTSSSRAAPTRSRSWTASGPRWPLSGNRCPTEPWSRSCATARSLSASPSGT